MRILLVNRPDAMAQPGGDTLQVERTREHLARLGAHVEATLSPDPHARGFDVVHLFNLHRARERLRQLRAARASDGHALIALSPIFRDTVELDAAFERWRCVAGGRRPGLRERLWVLRHEGMFRRRARRAVVSGADLVLVNSRAEVAEVERACGVSVEARAVRTPLGTDEPTPGPEPRAPRRVLQAGRIEFNKAQLVTIAALGTELGVEVVFAGAARPEDPYAAAFRDAIARAPNMRWLGPLDRDGLAAEYRRAAVHVQPSYIESFPLATCEAAAHGCRAVVTARSGLAEWFGPHLDTCEPGDPASLRAAVLRALARDPADDRLALAVRETCRWDAVARATLDAYERALASRPRT